MRRAASLALSRGELPRRAYAALELMLALTDERCSETWHSLKTIGQHGGGYDERTAGRWLAELAELGWLHRQHRFRVVQGHIEGATNLWRIVIPSHLRAELQAAEDAARSRKRAGRQAARPSRYTPPRPGEQRSGNEPTPSALYEAAERRRTESSEPVTPPAQDAQRWIQEIRTTNRLARRPADDDSERSPPAP